MHFSTMSEWLSWISSIHISEIELGLDRVKAVANRLEVLSPNCPVIIVGGTNGKGSTVAGLEAIYLAAGYQVGAFTTPILFKHNEQVRLNGKMAKDEAFCDAFTKIEASRGDISLTPFEFCALAALIIFKNARLDVMLLEVGLGGRLDAVNIIDADVAIVTSIGIDHVEWLGSTRESIAREKAGIFRPERPAISGDFDPPATLIDHAKKINAPFFCQGKDFHYQEGVSTWSWQFKDQYLKHLPKSKLAIQNMSTVLMAVTLMQSRLPVTREDIDKGLSTVSLQGRLQIVPGEPLEIYDVSHNPASVEWLAKKLETLPTTGKTLAVFSMLKDKDIATSIKTMKPLVTAWYVAPLAERRGASKDDLMNAMADADIEAVHFFETIKTAYEAAKKKASAQDRLIIFGSFHTVADVWKVRYTDS